MEATDFLAIFCIGFFLDVVIPFLVHDKDLVKLFWLFKWGIVWPIKKLSKINFTKAEKAAET